MQMITARAHAHVDSPVCACAHMQAQLTASRTGRTRAWVHTHSETHTGGGCGRWNLSHRDQRRGWCFCPDFRGSSLHFQQGNVRGMAHPSLQLKGQCGAPFLHLLPPPLRPAVILVLTQLCVIWSSPSSDLALSYTKSPQVGQGRPSGALTS